MPHHDPVGGLAAKEGSLEVDAHQPVPVLLSEIFDRKVLADPGIVDPDIDPAEPCDDRVALSADAVDVRNVKAHGLRFHPVAVQIFQQRRRLAHVDVGYYDGRPVLGELQRNRLPDTAAASCDDRNLLVQ